MLKLINFKEETTNVFLLRKNKIWFHWDKKFNWLKISCEKTKIMKIYKFDEQIQQKDLEEAINNFNCLISDFLTKKRNKIKKQNFLSEIYNLSKDLKKWELCDEVKKEAKKENFRTYTNKTNKKIIFWG